MTVSILKGDCREVLRTLPDESVHCVVTSPPYWGLRDYGTAKWEGGDAGCDHLGAPVRTQAGFNARYFGKEFATDKQGDERESMGQVCRKCGARRIDSQIGLEPSPDAYVAELVAVFREVRRVLRKDGTCWVNLGDSYAGGNHGGGGSYESERHWRISNPEKNGGQSNRDGLGRVTGLKPKDLVGIPWRVALALQADGWYLRQDIIWSKPNPMPESVRDRCTKAHEYIFLLSKAERYYYDAEAIAEEANYGDSQRESKKRGEFNGKTNASPGREAFRAITETRNRRSVWEIATAPFPEGHFATFPPALIEPCILAGCPKGGTVLDPFGGAGTTGLVADRLGRSAILVELNPEYAGMAERRLRDDAGMFADVATG